MSDGRRPPVAIRGPRSLLVQRAIQYARQEWARRKLREYAQLAAYLRRVGAGREKARRGRINQLLSDWAGGVGTGLVETGAAAPVARLLGIDEAALREMGPQIGGMIGQAFGSGRTPSPSAQETARLPGALESRARSVEFLEQALRNMGVEEPDIDRAMGIYGESGGVRGLTRPRARTPEAFGFGSLGRGSASSELFGGR